MYEEEVINAATKLGSGAQSKYYILTHAKHNREMYFRTSDDKRALKFIKPKFNTVKKRIIYFLLGIGVLQLFLRKIMIPDEIGSLVLVGGQIKGFDFDKKVVHSFPHTQWNNAKFVKDKENQIKMSRLGFAPNIIELNKYAPQSTEELCSPYVGNTDAIIVRLNKFHDAVPGYTHGDMRKEQVVIKDGKIMFIDWDLREGSPSDDFKML